MLTDQTVIGLDNLECDPVTGEPSSTPPTPDRRATCSTYSTVTTSSTRHIQGDRRVTMNKAQEHYERQHELAQRLAYWSGDVDSEYLNLVGELCESVQGYPVVWLTAKQFEAIVLDQLSRRRADRRKYRTSDMVIGHTEGDTVTLSYVVNGSGGDFDINGNCRGGQS
jgi:hypothetical protein